MSPWVLGRLACPCSQHASLEALPSLEQVQQLRCPACRRVFRVEDGIPVLLIDEAVPVGDEPAESSPEVPRG